METWLKNVFVLWLCMFVYISLIYAVYANYFLMWKYFDIAFSHFFSFLNNFVLRIALNNICSLSFQAFLFFFLLYCLHLSVPQCLSSLFLHFKNSFAKSAYQYRAYFNQSDSWHLMLGSHHIWIKTLKACI